MPDRNTAEVLRKSSGAGYSAGQAVFAAPATHSCKSCWKLLSLHRMCKYWHADASSAFERLQTALRSPTVPGSVPRPSGAGTDLSGLAGLPARTQRQRQAQSGCGRGMSLVNPSHTSSAAVQHQVIRDLNQPFIPLIFFSFIVIYNLSQEKIVSKTRKTNCE